MSYRLLEGVLLSGISFFIAWFLFLQFSSINVVHELKKQQQVNPFVEIQSLIHDYQTLLSQVKSAQSTYNQLVINDQGEIEIEKRLNRYKTISGHEVEKKSSLQILVRGNMSIEHIVRFIHEMYFYGADNISINGNMITYESFGFDDAGSTMLFDSKMLSFPLLVDVYGNEHRLRQMYYKDSPVFRPYDQSSFVITFQ